MKSLNLMSQSSTEKSPLGIVDLAEEEFDDVYSLLKTCIALEMGIDPKRVPDGEPFMKSCRRILEEAERDSGTLMEDMGRGFVPLFERLSAAKSSPDVRKEGVFYRVEFR